MISSSAGALPEIYGEAALYFDPKNVNELIENIKKVRDDRKYREKMIRFGKNRAKVFSWEKCAEETLSVYQEVLNKQ